jgi:alkanesulfonate monooxygenase
MGVEFNWHLPTEGDLRGRVPGDPTATPQHWVDVAQAAEYAGFHALLVPTGPQRPDAWLVAAALARHTERLRFVVALRPGFVLPAAAAQSVQSLQEITGHRLVLSVLTGGDVAEHHAYGDLVNHDDRFVRASEFLRVIKQVWKGRPTPAGFNHHGTHYRVESAGLLRPLRQPPALYVGGASPAAERVAAEHAELYYQWAEPPALLRERIARVRALAAAQGRTLRVGTRVHVIARDTEAEAWAEADRALQRAGLGDTPARSLEIAPQLWAGVGVLRGVAGELAASVQGGTALVGSYAQVAARIEEMQAAGVDSFIFSGEAGLEDALRFGEELLPLVRTPTHTAGSRRDD